MPALINATTPGVAQEFKPSNSPDGDSQPIQNKGLVSDKHDYHKPTKVSEPELLVSTESTSDNQVWKSIPGYEGLYEVSDQGNVKSFYVSNRRKGPYLSLSLASQYFRVKLCHDGKAVGFGVHQLVALAFIGPCPEEHEVNHIDGDKLNNRADNLEYLTRAENMLQAIEARSWLRR